MTLRELLTEAYLDPSVRDRFQSEDTPSFGIDDRDKRDLCSSFCNITVTLPNSASNDFCLTLHNVPWDADVEELVKRLEGEWQDTRTGRTLTMPMTIRSVPDVRRLARAIRKVTGRGKRYLDCNWKWSTRRTADSLERFARLLSEWNRSGRRMVPEEVPF